MNRAFRCKIPTMQAKLSLTYIKAREMQTNSTQTNLLQLIFEDFRQAAYLKLDKIYTCSILLHDLHEVTWSHPLFWSHPHLVPEIKSTGVKNSRKYSDLLLDVYNNYDLIFLVKRCICIISFCLLCYTCFVYSFVPLELTRNHCIYGFCFVT